MMKVVNDDVSSSDWTHFCHDEETGLPCCSTEVESKNKVSDSVCDVHQCVSDQVPAEGKWTYLMKSYKSTIVKYLVHESGMFQERWFHTRKRSRGDGYVAAADEENNGEQ